MQAIGDLIIKVNNNEKLIELILLIKDLIVESVKNKNILFNLILEINLNRLANN